MRVSRRAAAGGGTTAAESIISANYGGFGDGCTSTTNNHSTTTRFEGMAALLGLNREERVRAFDCVIRSISEEESISQVDAARETLTAVWDYLLATRPSQSDAYEEFQGIVKEHPSFLTDHNHHDTIKNEENTTISSGNNNSGAGGGAVSEVLSEIVSIDDETIRRKIVTPGIERVKAAKTPLETKRAMDQLYANLKKVFADSCEDAEIAEFVRKVVKESLQQQQHENKDKDKEEENDELVEILSVMDDVSRAVSGLESRDDDEMNDKNKCDDNENNNSLQGSLGSIARSRTMSPPPKPEDAGVGAITDDDNEGGLCKSPPPKPEDGGVVGVEGATDDGGGSATSIDAAQSLCKSQPPKPEDESNNGRDSNITNPHGLRMGEGEVEVKGGAVSSDREPRRPPPSMMMPEVPPENHHYCDNFSVLSDRIAKSRSPIPLLPPMPENSPVVAVDEDRVQEGRGGGGYRSPQPQSQLQSQPQKLPGKEAHRGESRKTERRSMETWEEDAMVEQMCKGMLYFLTLDGREQSMMFDKVVKRTAKDSGIPAKQAATITLQALSDALGHLQQQYEPQHQQSNGGGNGGGRGGDRSVCSSHISYPPLPKSPAPFSVSSAGLYDDSSAVPTQHVEQEVEEEMMMQEEDNNMVMIMNGEEKDDDDESSFGNIVVSTVEAIDINRTILLPGLIRVKQANSPQETCDAMDDMYRALAQHMPGQNEAGIMDFIVKVVRESINQERNHDGNQTI